ncbi:substrate-binding domain-containing protein [Pseudomonas helmanticensis]|uniref:substrate-binding domain-containing protein n=1 Tax=Pseudomonas helmanticensis TaxID=1471381 RepID=UPI003821138D
MFKRTCKVASLAVVALLSSQVMAVTGGGASLPAALYKGSANSILPANFSYAVTGSGIGKKALLTNDAAQFSTKGTVHFAASDSILSAAEISTYNTNFGASYGPLIQLPSVATAVAIPYKKAGNTTLNLTSAQLCDALSGFKTTWGALLGTADTTAIRVVYRSTSSGTTEILSRHLNLICPTKFAVNTTFTNARLPSGSQIPSHWVGVAMDQDVLQTVNQVDGSIGYKGPEGVDVKNNAQIARINGIQPIPANVAIALSSSPLPSQPANLQHWVPVVANPSSGYSVSGYSNLILGQCYQDGAVAADIKAFLAKHYSVPGNNAVSFAHGFIPVPTYWKTAIIANFVTNTTQNNLDINNPNVCTGIGRPL